jgi:hypothetical protein
VADVADVVVEAAAVMAVAGMDAAATADVTAADAGAAAVTTAVAADAVVEAAAVAVGAAAAAGAERGACEIWGRRRTVGRLEIGRRLETCPTEFLARVEHSAAKN